MLIISTGHFDNIDEFFWGKMSRKCLEMSRLGHFWDISRYFRDIFPYFCPLWARQQQQLGVVKTSFGLSSEFRRETLSQTAFHLPSLLKQSCPVAIQDLWKQVSQYNTMRVRVNSFFLPFKCFKEKNYEWNFFFKYYLILQLKVKPCGPIFDQ